MARRKNTRRFDPRYFMDEKTDIIKETEWHDLTAGETAPPHSKEITEPQRIIQRIESAYHDLQDAFAELDDATAKEMARRIISDLETLMDTQQYPDDYRE
jgi:predicted lipid-binding transport protein (Tim44 family)